MKRFILPIILLLTVVFFLSPKVNAQERVDCHTPFTNESNSCMKEKTKCLSSCVDKASSEMSLTIDGGKINLECQRSVCDSASEACSKAAKDKFDACIQSRKAKEASSKETESGNEDKEPAGWELPGKEFGEFIRKIQSIRLGKPVGIGSEALSEKKTPVQSVNDWILENLGPYEPVIETKNTDRAPILTTQAGSDEALRLTDEMLAPGAKVETSKNSVIITKPDGSRVWFEQNGDVIYYKREDWTTIRLKEKEVEVQTEGSKIEVETPGATIKTKGTHYWVSYDRENNETSVGVYEGEVEVKTRDGKTTNVAPKDGKPGVVVISQKLSPVKVAVAGLVVTVVLGGIILLLKKKFASKGLGKKKK